MSALSIQAIVLLEAERERYTAEVAEAQAAHSSALDEVNAKEVRILLGTTKNPEGTLQGTPRKVPLRGHPCPSRVPPVGVVLAHPIP